jgi:hypothetical protein
MNVDLDFLAKEWPVITGAPHLVFEGIIAITVLVGSVTWFFVNWSYRHRIAVFEDRLKLADEKTAWANNVKDESVKAFKALNEFNELKAVIAANARADTLKARVDYVETAVIKLEAANNAFRSVIGIATGASVSPQGAIPDFAPSLETHAVVADRIDPT